MVGFHHEDAPGEVHDSCVFLAERVGSFTAAPAKAELMYQPETRGQSQPFVLNVAEKP